MEEKPTESAVLDPATISELHHLEDSGNQGFLRQIVDAFVSDGAVRLKQIETALGLKDREGLSTAAHTLKGGSLSVGARPLADLCRRLETSAGEGDLAGAAEQFGLLREEFERVREALEKEAEKTT
ncbi:MAG: Hpt domain-containing protein [Actinomycetota bacterium]